VAFTIFIIVVKGVAAHFVERDLGFAIMRDEPSLFDRRRVALADPAPIIGIAANAKDRLFARHNGKRRLQMRHEPGLARNWPGLGIIGMLVIIHQHEPVRHPPIGSEVPILIIHRHRDRHQPMMRRIHWQR
jgi:hypothetical protein